MTDETEILPVVKEELTVSTRKVVSGLVRVSTRTESVESTVSADLTDTEVDVVRVPVGRRIEAVPEVITDGDLTIVPVVEERLVVTKELWLREEVHIRHVERRQVQELPVTTRSQTVHVERVPSDHGTQATNPIAKDYHDDL